MAEKKKGPTGALVTVLEALEALEESDRQWVLQSAAARWNVQSASQGAGAGGGAGSSIGGAGAAEAQAAIAQKNARAFMRLKNPATDVQRVACLGYFLVHITTGKQGFSSKEIGEANTESGGSAFNLARALDNATRQSKYLSNRGAREKQLTTLGEDIVAALPDQQAVRDIEAAARGRGRGRRAKRKKKA
jgi:type IV secretory pathway TrbL component